MSQEFRKERAFSAEQETAIIDKLWTAARASRVYTEAYGKVLNQEKAGDVFFHALYHPIKLDPTLLQKLSARDRSVLKKMIGLATTLSREQFVQKYRHVLTSEVDFGQTYFDGAREAVREMATRGPVRLWTTGDVHGVPELGLRGSREQLKRVARGESLKGRHTVNRASQGLGLPARVSVEAYEKKTSAEAVRKILREFEALGVERVIVVDDDVKNLEGFKARAEKISPDTSLVLVVDQQDIQQSLKPGQPPRRPLTGSFKSMDEAIKALGLVKVDDIRELVSTILERKDCKGRILGWVVDHDGVLSNDDKRRELQEQAILQWLRQL